MKEFTQQWSKVTGVRTVITYPLTPKSLTTLAFTVNEKTAVIFKRPGLLLSKVKKQDVYGSKRFKCKCFGNKHQSFNKKDH